MKEWIFSLGLILVIAIAGSATADSGGIITKEELKKIIDAPDLVILDVRTGRDWRSSEFKIKGAVRAKVSEFKNWIGLHAKDKRYVTYCA